MKNLAGHPEADAHCALELAQAGIEIAFLPAPRADEVSTNVTGKVGGITLTRNWRHWVADGLVPLAIAERLYADPIGKRDVRVNGHCGCPAPGTPGGRTLNIADDGEPIVLDPDGSQEAEFDAFVASSSLDIGAKPRFVREMPADAKRYVTRYSIDSAEGLKLFADAIKAGA